MSRPKKFWNAPRVRKLSQAMGNVTTALDYIIELQTDEELPIADLGVLESLIVRLDTLRLDIRSLRKEVRG